MDLGTIHVAGGHAGTCCSGQSNSDLTCKAGRFGAVKCNEDVIVHFENLACPRLNAFFKNCGGIPSYKEAMISWECKSL